MRLRRRRAPAPQRGLCSEALREEQRGAWRGERTHARARAHTHTHTHSRAGTAARRRGGAGRGRACGSWSTRRSGAGAHAGSRSAGLSRGRKRPSRACASDWYGVRDAACPISTGRGRGVSTQYGRGGGGAPAGARGRGGRGAGRRRGCRRGGPTSPRPAGARSGGRARCGRGTRGERSAARGAWGAHRHGISLPAAVRHRFDPVPARGVFRNLPAVHVDHTPRHHGRQLPRCSCCIRARYMRPRRTLEPTELQASASLSGSWPLRPTAAARICCKH